MATTATSSTARICFPLRHYKLRTEGRSTLRQPGHVHHAPHAGGRHHTAVLRSQHTMQRLHTAIRRLDTYSKSPAVGLIEFRRRCTGPALPGAFNTSRPTLYSTRPQRLSAATWRTGGITLICFYCYFWPRRGRMTQHRAKSCLIRRNFGRFLTVVGLKYIKWSLVPPIFFKKYYV